MNKPGLIEPFMQSGHALLEAGRCLGCHDAPCSQACPAGVDVPGFIRRLRDGNPNGAGALIYQKCPLGATCGMACPTAMLCEGACVLKKSGQAPVRIGALQTFTAMQSREAGTLGSVKKPARVAIVGAGPSGLGCAVALRRRGHTVMLYDQSDRPGGLVERVIPAHRLPAGPFGHDLELLSRLDLPFSGKQVIHAASFRRMQKDYDAVFLAGGMAAVPAVDFPGRQVPGVLDALAFLENARKHSLGKGDNPVQDGTVIVVGGGNVALDAAVVARRLGAAEVIVLYRRSKDEMPGWETEYLEAARLGVEFRWLSTLTSVDADGMRVGAASIQRMRFCGEMRGGRRWVEVDEEQPPYRINCRQVILAPGQSVASGWLKEIGLDLDENDHPIINPVTHRTSLPGVFAGGEMVQGASTIVACLRQGLDAGTSIARLLEGEAR